VTEHHWTRSSQQEELTLVTLTDLLVSHSIPFWQSRARRWVLEAFQTHLLSSLRSRGATTWRGGSELWCRAAVELGVVRETELADWKV